jgi:hypothetical protein
MSPPYNPTDAVNTIRSEIENTADKRMPPAVREVLAEVTELDRWLSQGNRSPAQWGRRRAGRTPLSEDGWVNPALTPEQHGRRYGYNQHCRCIPCRAANRHEDPQVILAMKRERGWA